MLHQDIRLDIVLSDSGQDCVDLSPMENYNFGWGPNFTESPFSFVLMFYDLQWKITSCWHGTLPQKVRHQNIKLDRVLSHSGQHCVDLSPIKNYNFGCGPNFVELIFFGSDVLRLATEAYIPFGCARCLTRTLGSSQDCVDLSPMENYNFGWGQKFVRSPFSLLQMFYDLQGKIACCSNLAQAASPEH